MAKKSLSGYDINGPLLLTGAAGSGGQVLTSGGTGATPTWTSISGGGLSASNYVVAGSLAADQAITVASTDTLISFVDNFDPQNWWNPSSKRFTPTVAGYYSVTLQVLWTALSSTSQTNAQIRKNGNSETIQQRTPDANTPYFMSATKTIYMNGSTDYIEFTVWSPVTTQSISQGNSAGSGTNFSASLITSGANITSNPLTIGTTGLKMTTGSSPWNGSAAATIDVDNTKVALLTGSTFTGAVSATTLTSTIATGTAPLTVTSTTVVPNLTANTVGQSFIIKADSGTTEGTDLYTFNGGTAKTLNIVAGSNITVTKTAGQWSIALNSSIPTNISFTNTITFSNTSYTILNGIVATSNGGVPAGSTLVGNGDTVSNMTYGTPNYLRWRSGVYYAVSGATTSTYTGTLTSIYMTPMYIPQKTTLTKIGINVATAGTTGALIKLGIYNNSTTATTGDVPTTLLLDAGTVASDTTGYKEITISQAVTPGLYWLVYQMTVATCGITAVNTYNKDIAALTVNPTTFYSGYQVNTTSGAAFPAGPVTITIVPVSSSPRIFLGT